MGPLSQPPSPQGWGFSVTDDEAGPHGMLAQAADAEDLGCSLLLGAESDTVDGVSMAAAVIAETSRAQVATGVLNVYSRTPYTLAQTAATLQELSGGRFVLGLGASSAGLVRGAHDMEYGSALDRVRRASVLVRSLLAGERMPVSGDGGEGSGARLRLLPERPVPLLLAALGPRMLDLVGELADVALLALTCPAALTEARERTKAYGRTVTIAARLLVPWPGDDADAVAAVRRTLAIYAQVPAYARALTRGGRGPDVRRVTEAFQRGGLGRAADAVSDALLCERALVGAVSAQRERLREHRVAGCDLPVLAITPGTVRGSERRAAVADALRCLAS